MLKVTIELHPFGREEKKTTLNEVFIANVGNSGEANHSNYHVWEEDPRERQDKKVPAPKAQVKDFNRDLGALHLTMEAIEAVLIIHGIEKMGPLMQGVDNEAS